MTRQLGCRAEYWFSPPQRDGAAAAAAVDEELEGFMHLWALNRGILLTPFHNMALFSPHLTEDDVDLHTEVFRRAVEALLAAPSDGSATTSDGSATTSDGSATASDGSATVSDGSAGDQARR
jgi:hypothetical protein